MPLDSSRPQPSLPGLCPIEAAVTLMAAAGIEDRGAVFTRREVVEFILDLVGYTADKPLHWARILELKSQVGPSFGNNFNNRTEEALGTAVDLWTAYREGAFGKETPRPFAGWLMLVEDAPSSRSPVRDSSPHFEVFPDFRRASYLERYNILCRKLTQEPLYTTATIMASPRTAAESGDYSDLSELTSLKTFVTSFAGHIAAEAARSG